MLSRIYAKIKSSRIKSVLQYMMKCMCTFSPVQTDPMGPYRREWSSYTGSYGTIPVQMKDFILDSCVWLQSLDVHVCVDSTSSPLVCFTPRNVSFAKKDKGCL